MTFSAQRSFPVTESSRWAWGASALGCVGILVVHWEAFTGTRLIPYDAVTDYYPWFYNAVQSARRGLFITINPYKLGGMVNFHLFANYDPIYWIALLVPGQPSIVLHQVLSLSHLMLVPISLVLIARVHGVSGSALFSVAGLGVVAAFIGPALIYQQHLSGLDSYCWGFFALAMLEAFLRRGGLVFSVLFALGMAFAFMRFSTEAVFWPWFIVPYVALSWARIKSYPHGARHLLIAAGVGFVLVLPYMVLAHHMWESLTATLNIEVNNTLVPVETLSMLGMPAVTNSLIAIPTVLLILSGLSIAGLPLRLRIFYCAFVVVSFTYAFSQLTPFADLVRHVYPPAAYFRRPYAILYVVLPVLFSLVAQNWAHLARQLPVWLKVTLSLAVVLVTTALELRDQRHWTVAILLSALTLSAVWLSRYRQVLWLALVLQWAILIYRPFVRSNWREVRRPATEFARAYPDLTPFLSPHSSNSTDLFRTLSAGMDANFGSYSSVLEYYNLAPDFSTLFPRKLVQRTHVERLHAAAIIDFVAEHPEVIGSPGLEEMGVRYYVFSGALLDRIRGSLKLDGGSLQQIPLPGSFARVVEDTAALPFVHSHDAAGKVSSVEAVVTPDRVTFTVPGDSESVDLAYIYDSWWHVDGNSRVGANAVVDDEGQLRLESATFRRQTVTLAYGSMAFRLTLVSALFAYIALLVLGLFQLVRTWRAGRNRIVDVSVLNRAV